MAILFSAGNYFNFTKSFTLGDNGAVGVWVRIPNGMATGQFKFILSSNVTSTANCFHFATWCFDTGSPGALVTNIWDQNGVGIFDYDFTVGDNVDGTEDTWHLLIANKNGIQVDTWWLPIGSEATAPQGTATSVEDDTVINGMYIGRYDGGNGSGIEYNWDNELAELFYVDRTLTINEITALAAGVNITAVEPAPIFNLRFLTSQATEIDLTGNEFDAVRTGTPTTVAHPFTDPVQQIYLETSSGQYSVEQTVSVWDTGSADITAISGNWLNVLNETLPDGTPGVPFSFGIHNIVLRLEYDNETATRAQDYLPPSGYTALEYSSSGSNTTDPNSIWNGLSTLINGDQILVANSQTAIDSTPITVSWSANGVGTPSQNLNYIADFVYFDNSNGQLSLLDKTFTAQTAGIVSVNGGTPLDAGESFTIEVSNINANDIGFVYLEITGYRWILSIDSVVNSTTVSCIAPSNLVPGLSNITIRVKENKVARNLRNFNPEDDDEINWLQTPQTSSFLATSFAGYLVDTSSNVVTLTLPATPVFGDKVAYMDLAGTFNSNIFTINPNGNNLHGSTDSYTTSSNNESGILFYSGTTYGWKFLNVNPTI